MTMNEKAEIIADLYVLKNTLIKPYSLEYREVQSNITYSVIEMIIAHLLDKHKIKYEEVEHVLRERVITNPNNKEIKECLNYYN